MKYFIYIQSGGSTPLYLYEGRSENQAEYYYNLAISIMKITLATGTLRYHTADVSGTREFRNGEEV